MSGGGNASAPLLTVEGLQVAFNGSNAVNGISFSMRQGEMRGLVGESGSGKTVTGMTLMGLTRQIGATVSGRAVLAGANSAPVDLISADEAQLRRVRGARVAMVFQDSMSALNPFHRVGDQIREAITAHGAAAPSQADRRAVELLGEVGIPEPARRARDFPHEFSGGMRQRVMIAMALANEPELLIADEPTTALDMTTQARILDRIVRLRESHGMAVLLISHDLGVIAERTEQVTVMRSGRVIEQGKSATVFAQPGESYTRQLLAAVPRIDGPRPWPRPRPAGGSALVETEGLTFTYPARRGIFGRAGEDVRAVDDVNLRVEQGGTLGVVGESGSGKSTLCRLLLGLLPPEVGTVRFDDAEITAMKSRDLRRLRGSMQIIFQDPYTSLNPRHRVATIIAAPIRLHLKEEGQGLKRRVAELLERVGLNPHDGDRYPHEFSSGQRQRIAIARALGPKPRLIVADEPVSALDVTIQAQILELMDTLQRDLDLTYVFVSHDLAVIRQIADEVVVMRKGRVVETGDAETICTAPRDPYTRRLLDAVPRLPVA